MQCPAVIKRAALYDLEHTSSDGGGGMEFSPLRGVGERNGMASGCSQLLMELEITAPGPRKLVSFGLTSTDP